MTNWTPLIAAAVILPTLVVALSPGRWLIPGMALVLVSPAILYVAVIVWEMLTRPPQANPLDLAVSGFMLISAFVVLPWLILCAICFAIGLGLRRLVRGNRDRRAVVQPVPASMPVITNTQALAGGHAGSGSPGNDNAAGVSPTYREVSTDGSIRVDFDAQEWGNSHWVISSRVIETATGRVLLDLWGTDWDATVSFPGERKAHLFLRRYRRGGVLAVDIDLMRETFQIVLEPGHEGPRPEAPLKDIAIGLEAASARSTGISGSISMEAGTPRPQRAWRVALLSVAVILAVVSAAGLLAASGTPEPGQLLAGLWDAAWRAVR